MNPRLHEHFAWGVEEYISRFLYPGRSILLFLSCIEIGVFLMDVLLLFVICVFRCSDGCWWLVVHVTFISYALTLELIELDTNPTLLFTFNISTPLNAF
jgi:hypothetical protein